ncbi:hypothetical protein A9236_06860 [Polynucleobacter sp. QLW-P1DATA-2]|uniref:hypothetical protein n=1 Tax=Polynucleobacter sp. QLW-P1DATA-2 TaxID=1743167 RepID=UPI0008F8641D|nr:hypothetical protein [Polynucleobacter sp. QLW-P1DATA-2]OIN00906.1 hypothetical protein A9236_06860 [Polynucleobacter sp. QLW-P1DATA-2]
MKLSKYNNIYIEFISVLIGITILLCTDLLIAKNTLPLTEGWWEVIAKESNSMELYKDLYIGLPPLYINFIAFLQGFTENIYILRLIFIGIHFLEAFTLAYFFSKFFNFTVSMVAVIISELLISTYITTYLTKDYHLFLQLLINLYLLSCFYFYKTKKFYSIIALGLFTSGILLTKQNYGVILFIANYFIFFTIKGNFKNKLISAALFTIYVFAFLFLYTNANGLGWLSTYIGNDAKGGIITIISRVLSEKSTIQIILSLLAFYACFSIKDGGWLNFIKESDFDRISTKFNYVKIIKIIIFMLAIYLGVRVCSNKDFNLCILIVYFYLLSGIIKYWGMSKKGIDYIDFGILSIPLIAILYCNTLTAGYNFSGFQVGVAVLFCLLLSLIGSISINLRNLVSAIFFIIIGINFYSTKYMTASYNWWGYRLDSIAQANYHLDNKYLAGLNLTSDSYDVISKVSELNLKNNSFYIYPNIPLFYYIFNIDLKSKFPVLWFDVVPNKYKSEAVSEFEKINPEYVLWLKPMKSTYDGHYKLKQSESVMTLVDQHILSRINAGKLKLIWSRPMGTVDSKSSDIDSPILAVIECQKCSAINFDDLIANYSISSVKLMNSTKKIYEIEFANGFKFINFVDNYNPTIINSNYPIFSIYKRVDR